MTQGPSQPQREGRRVSYDVNADSGLTKSAAATIGEMSQPIAGSMARGSAAIVFAAESPGAGNGSTSAGAPPLIGVRHFARSRFIWEKLPV